MFLIKLIITDIATRKYNFIKKLTLIDESLLEKLELVLLENIGKDDWSNQLSEEEKAEINQGIQEANSDKLVDNDFVMNKFEKWH